MNWLQEDSVTQDLGGVRITTTRQTFEYLGRFLGSQTIRTERYVQNDTWTWVEEHSTVAFPSLVELREWVDEMYREHDVEQVRRSGGTKLVVLS